MLAICTNGIWLCSGIFIFGFLSTIMRLVITINNASLQSVLIIGMGEIKYKQA